MQQVHLSGSVLIWTLSFAEYFGWGFFWWKGTWLASRGFWRKGLTSFHRIFPKFVVCFWAAHGRRAFWKQCPSSSMVACSLQRATCSGHGDIPATWLGWSWLEASLTQGRFSAIDGQGYWGPKVELQDCCSKCKRKIPFSSTFRPSQLLWVRSHCPDLASHHSPPCSGVTLLQGIGWLASSIKGW